MKKMVFSLACLITAIISNSQKPAFEWAKSFGGPKSELGTKVILDREGNIYSSGIYYETLELDETHSFTSTGLNDFYIAKTDKSGKLLWAKNFGGPDYDDARGIALDAAGDIYITGSYGKTVDFDPSASGVFNLKSGGESTMFILKLSAAGDFVWAKNTEGTGQTNGSSIALDRSGNIFITGSIKGTADFDPGAGISKQTSVHDAQDMFVLKLDQQGNFAWVKKSDGKGLEFGTSIGIDSIGNIYCTGNFSGSASFETETPEFMLKADNPGNKDIFIIKMDASGKMVWAKKIGGIQDDEAYAIVVDALGNNYITGCFRYSFDFDPNRGEFFVSTNEKSAFLCKMDASGNFGWVKSLGENSKAEGQAVALDRSGNIYTTGYFGGTTFIGKGLTAVGYQDIFIMKYTPSGKLLWLIQLGGGLRVSDGKGIAIGGGDEIYITGAFEETIDLDPGENKASFKSKGDYDIYLCKLIQPVKEKKK